MFTRQLFSLIKVDWNWNTCFLSLEQNHQGQILHHLCEAPVWCVTVVAPGVP